MITHAPLFAGINGFGVAADWMGWHQPFHCEIDPWCQTVLQYYWPNSQPYYDIKQTDFTIWRNRIDILTGGFPCQPYSAAGSRKGTEDDRHLWPEMLRAIREIQPPIVVAENVRGLVNWDRGMVFEQVQIDLENEGYEVTPFLLPAASVGAPHERYRVWFVGHSKKFGWNEGCIKEASKSGIKIGISNSKFTSNTTKQGCKEWKLTTNTTMPRYEPGQQPSHEIREKKPGTLGQLEGQFERFCSPGNVANANGIRLRGKGNGIGSAGFIDQTCSINHWQNFPTQSPVCGRNDGLPTELHGITFSKWRKESIKAYGNAIVPQVAFEIFKVIEQMMNNDPN